MANISVRVWLCETIVGGFCTILKLAATAADVVD